MNSSKKIIYFSCLILATNFTFTAGVLETSVSSEINKMIFKEAIRQVATLPKTILNNTRQEFTVYCYRHTKAVAFKIAHAAQCSVDPLEPFRILFHNGTNRFFEPSRYSGPVICIEHTMIPADPARYEIKEEKKLK